MAAGMGEASKTVLKNVPATNSRDIASAIGGNRWVAFSSDTNAVTAQSITIERDSLASVKGMGLKDALYILENQGFKVEFSGHGRVREQSPAPGTAVEKGQVVHLTLGN